MIERRIISNAFFLVCSDVVIRGAGAVAGLLVARQIGATQYGALALAVTIGVFASYLTDLGLTDTFIREGSRSGADVGGLLRSVLTLRLALAVAATLLVALVTALVYPADLQPLLLITVVPMVWGEALQGMSNSYFSLKQTMQYAAMIRGLGGVLSVAMLLSGVAMHASPTWLGAAYGVSSLIAGVVAVLLIRHAIGKSGQGIAALMGGLGHFTAAGVLTAALPQLGTLILERVSTLTGVAYYAAAFRVPALLMQVPRSISAAFYPPLFQSGLHDRAQHLRLMGDFLRLNLLVGLSLTLPVALYSDTIIGVLLGPSWLPVAGTVLSLLAWTILLRAVSAPLSDGAVTLGRVSARSRILTAQTALAVPLYIGFARYAGAIGAAWATLGLEALSAVAFIVVTPSVWLMFRRSISVGLLMPTAAVVLVRLIAGPSVTSLLLSVAAFVIPALLFHRDLRFSRPR